MTRKNSTNTSRAARRLVKVTDLTYAQALARLRAGGTIPNLDDPAAVATWLVATAPAASASAEVAAVSTAGASADASDPAAQVRQLDFDIEMLLHEWDAHDDVDTTLGVAVCDAGRRLVDLLRQAATVPVADHGRELTALADDLAAVCGYYADLEEHETAAAVDIVDRLMPALATVRTAVGLHHVDSAGDVTGLADARAVCECGSWADECDRDHDAEAASGHTSVVYDDGTVVPLCPVCHSTGCACVVVCRNCGFPVERDSSTGTGWTHREQSLRSGGWWCNPEFTADNVHTTTEPVHGAAPDDVEDDPENLLQRACEADTGADAEELLQRSAEARGFDTGADDGPSWTCGDCEAEFGSASDCDTHDCPGSPEPDRVAGPACRFCHSPAGPDYHLAGVIDPGENNVVCDGCWDERLR